MPSNVITIEGSTYWTAEDALDAVKEQGASKVMIFGEDLKGRPFKARSDNWSDEGYLYALEHVLHETKDDFWGPVYED